MNHLEDTPSAPTPAPNAPASLADQVRQVLRESANPLTFPELKKAITKLYPKGTKKDPKPPAPSDEDIQRELEAGMGEKTIFEHPPKANKKRYATTPPPTPEEVVRGLVADKLATGDGPFAEADLAKKPKDLSKEEFNDALAKVINGLKERGELFEHPPVKKKKQYGKVAPPPPPPPPDPVVVVSGLVEEKLQTGDGPFAEADLAKKPKTLSKEEFSEALAKVIKGLKERGELFEHPGKGKKKLYGKVAPPPPPWYETPAYAKPFAALVKATQKVVGVGEVSMEEVLAALKEKVRGNGQVATTRTEPVVSEPPHREPPETARTPVDLRTALKEAYDHLCHFVEFRDRLVELPRLYHEAKKRKPDLTVDEFHRELWELNEERQIELHVLNEVHSAREPNLAIHRNDRLYYYARWK